MAGTSLYVPVLKSKKGEYLALRSLRFSCQRRITPLIEISPPVKSPEENADKSLISVELGRHVTEIGRSWRYSDAPFFLDTRLVRDPAQALRTLAVLLKNHFLVPT